MICSTWIDSPIFALPYDAPIDKQEPLGITDQIPEEWHELAEARGVEIKDAINCLLLRGGLACTVDDPNLSPIFPLSCGLVSPIFAPNV